LVGNPRRPKSALKRGGSFYSTKSNFSDKIIVYKVNPQKLYRNVSSSRLNRSVGVDVANFSCTFPSITAGDITSAICRCMQREVQV
jgi:hypothetical protein